MPKFLVFATLLAALFLSVLVGAVTTVMLSGPSDRSERQLGIEVVEHPLRPDNSIADKVPEQTGVLRHHADRTSTGFTLYSTVDPARRVNLLNMAGEIVHSWTTPSELLPDEEQLSPTAVSQLPVIHPQLLSGGDIVLAIQRDTMLQKPGGIARMDKDSKVKWLLPGLVGHALNVTANDKVYGVLHGAIEQPLPGYEKIATPFFDELIVEIDREGEVLRTISMFDAVHSSRFGFLLQYIRPGAHAGRMFGVSSIQYLDTKTAAAVSFAQPGDLLLALADMDVILVLDMNRERVRWAVRGTWHRPSGAELLANGELLVFDSFGDIGKGGFSRVSRVDPLSLRKIWSFPKGSEEKLFSSQLGSVESLPNGNTLIGESNTGRILEIAGDGTVVWEYISPHSVVAEDSGVVRRATFARRFVPDQIDFNLQSQGGLE